MLPGNSIYVRVFYNYINTYIIIHICFVSKKYIEYRIRGGLYLRIT